MCTDPYAGREQTKAKHFILRSYLQSLAFKVLTFSDIAYVDGFSGPWETKTDDFRDSSFMIAISVLKDAQQQILERRGIQRRIRCFFSESNRASYALLKKSVADFHRPEEHFEIRTHEGKFEDAVADIQSFIGRSFPLIFIDPTGWTGYPFEKISPLFAREKCEVLINFMYDFINRFSYSTDTETIRSLDPILGGAEWQDRLDANLPRGLGVEKLFRETLKTAGNFRYVVSTKIDKATIERPHFFIAYATKSADGLKTFRQTEYDALKKHARDRVLAIEKQRELRLNTIDMFTHHQIELGESSIDEIVSEQRVLATSRLLDVLLERGPLKFSQVVSGLLQQFLLRETNVKDICVGLARDGKIENTWGGGNRKPRDADPITLR